MISPTRTFRISRRTVVATAALAPTTSLLTTTAAHADGDTAGPSGRTRSARTKPGIVLMHGAFADASGFGDVIAGLQRRGYTVHAPANPLRGLMADSDYLKAFLATITGPLIVAGHSYGGAVITNAATGNPNVKALVYIAAYALDEGETAVKANDLGGGPAPLLNSHLVLRPFPGSGTANADVTIDPEFFRQVFAADLPVRQTKIMGASQRPVTFSSLAEKSGVPAWRTIPSSFVVAAHDNAIPPAAERAMAKRAGSRTVEIDSSHVAMTSHPRVVTELILEAARSHC